MKNTATSLKKKNVSRVTTSTGSINLASSHKSATTKRKLKQEFRHGWIKTIKNTKKSHRTLKIKNESAVVFGGVFTSHRHALENARQRCYTQDLSNVNLLKGYKRIRVVEGNAVPDKNKDILIVTVNYPKLGEKTKTFWDKMFAEYFEGSITFEGIK